VGGGRVAWNFSKLLTLSHLQEYEAIITPPQVASLVFEQFNAGNRGSGSGANVKRKGLGRDKRIGFVDLGRRHDLGKGFEASQVGVVAGGDGEGVPGVGGDIVERQAFAILVEIGEKGLGARIALLGGEECPVGGL